MGDIQKIHYSIVCKMVTRNVDATLLEGVFPRAWPYALKYCNAFKLKTC